MCGIAGYISKTGEFRPDKQILKRMTDKIRHRGPDAEGQWHDEKVALGHRRLSIIDLDAKSNQPMFSHDGRFVLTYNGEVYNYIEIKKDLLADGATFLTNSDSEVIIEAYRKYGAECFNMFNGMWALAIYDRQEKKIILSRDRFAVKPLYILDRRDVFAFGSEIKAILTAFPEETVSNDVWIYRYLSFKLNYDVDEETAYKNIKRFPAAHYMIYNLDTDEKKFYRYWDVDEEKFRRRWIDGKDPLETFKELFDSAVTLRLRSDVEVGSCLSGGIDSSSIVGCASYISGRQMHTFSSIYEDKDCNEEFYIRKVNEKWNTIPHYILPDDYEKNFTHYVEELTYHHDQPSGGSSLYSGYMVMKGVHGHVKVLLDGQGADELFAGYLSYYGLYIRDLLKKGGFFNKCKVVDLLVFINSVWPNLTESYIDTPSLVRTIGLKNSDVFYDESWRDEVTVRRKSQIFTDNFIGDVKDKYEKKKFRIAGNLNNRLCEDFFVGSIPAILHNEDGNSMAFSIETRLPFMDYRIVEFALALGEEYKIKHQWTKWIVRQACKKYLPTEVYKRTNKMGFPAPFGRWIRSGKDKNHVKEVIFAFGKRGIVPSRTIEDYYAAHMEGGADLDLILFKLYSMELWLGMRETGRFG